MKPLAVHATLRGRHFFVIGGTGFLGKVFLATVARNVPDIGSLTCLVRRGREGQSAAERFATTCWDGPVFAPVRDALGDRADAFLREKLHIVEGDVTQASLGLHPEAAETLANRCDLVINISGLVNFNPPLADAFAVNVAGAHHVAQFTAACRNAALMHISTCFVVGRQSGTFSEEVPLVDWSPSRARQFDHRKEIATVSALLQRHADAKVATNIGKGRAALLGWPNIYTYTKALGEQAIAGMKGLRATIVRPSIIESAMQFPAPGWNEGINTSAPLAFLGLLGQARYPCGKGVILDVIPVDSVANAMGVIAAAVLRREAKPLYQLGSSDVNPLTMREALELTGLFKRKYLSDNASKELAKGLGMPNWLRYLMAQWEAVPVSADHFYRFSAPRIRAGIDRLLTPLATWRKERRGATGAIVKQLHEAGKALHTLAARSEKIFAQYLPFIHDHIYCFQGKHLRTLHARLAADEQTTWHWAPASIDWRSYWVDIHLAGLARHVFPKMTAQLQGKHGRPMLPHLSFLVPMVTIPEGLKVRDLRLPQPIRRLTKMGLGRAQHWLYDTYFQTTVIGRGYIPANRAVLVVANHASHLDMGLVKYALGAYGRTLRALAAKDYFFRDGIRRIFFGNCTNLLPIDRSADLQESLRPALEALKRGEVLLMFPEGTRTTTGEMGRFKRGAGYLALAGGVDILPVFLHGTFAAMPKGQLLIPRQRTLGARIGPVIAHVTLLRAVDGLQRDESYRHAAALIEDAVRTLHHQTPDANRQINTDNQMLITKQRFGD